MDVSAAAVEMTTLTLSLWLAAKITATSGRLHRPWAFAALFELFAHAELRRHVPRGQGVAVGAQPALTRHGRGARRGSGRVIYAP